MAVNFLNNIDLNNNQLLNARVHVNGSAPAGAGKGSIWLNSSTNELNFHNGTEFISVIDDTTIANTNTQNVFATSFVDSSNDVLLRLTKSGASSGTQDIKFVAGSNVTLTPSGTNLTITSANTQNSAATTIAMFSGSGVISLAANGTISSSAEANVATNLSKTTSTTNVTVNSSTGDNIALGAASTSVAGVMTKAMFDKLNGIETSATADQTAAQIRTAVGTGNSNFVPAAPSSATTKFLRGDGSFQVPSYTTNTDTNVDVSTLETRLGQINSNVTIGNSSSVNTTISGDLIVNGDTTTVTSTTVAIGDNMMLMAKDNSANSKDIGWYGKIVAEGAKYPSMFYDASSGVAAPTFQVGLATTEPGAATSSIAVKGIINANLTGNVTGALTGNASTATTLASTRTFRTNLASTSTANFNGAANATPGVTGTLGAGNGGTGLTSITTLLNSNVTKSSLGLVIGTNVQAYDAQLDTLAGMTSGEINAFAALTATEIGKIDGLTPTTTELNYVDGVTSAIQTQLNAKQATISSSNRVNATNVGTGVISNTELNYLNGVTSAIQTQLNTITSANLKITKKISGTGSATSFTVTHSFGTPRVMTQLLDYGDNGTGATYDVVHADIRRNSDNAVDVVFGIAPLATQDYLVLITKMPAIS